MKKIGYLKIVMIGALGVGMLILLFLIGGLVRDRSSTKKQVSNEISSKWGSNQLIIGPILAIPFEKATSKRVMLDGAEKTTITYSTDYLYLLPKQLKTDQSLVAESRKRGIYSTIVYKSVNKISGNFEKINLESESISTEDVKWDKAKIIMGVSDLKGLGKVPMVVWNNKQIEIELDKNEFPFIENSLVAPINISMSKTTVGTFDIQIDLQGAEHLSLAPLGKENRINIKGNWPNPSFDGAYLPTSRGVNTDGFNASWSIQSFDRGLPQQWIGAISEPNSPVYKPKNIVTVGLLNGVDLYQQTERTLKYGILIIGLSFIALLFTELISHASFHIIHYGLIGVALVLFYTLLLSFSEHIGFNWAYLFSFFATTVLICLFVLSISKSLKTSLIFAATLSVFYGFNFVLMQLEDYALLVGSVGMFVILSILMYVSSKVNFLPKNID